MPATGAPSRARIRRRTSGPPSRADLSQPRGLHSWPWTAVQRDRSWGCQHGLARAGVVPAPRANTRPTRSAISRLMTLLLGTSLVPYGIDMARPGLLTARDVLN